MGIFDIESDGMILKTEKDYDLFSVRQGQMMAHKKITSIVKVYDIYRETSEADFYEGKSNDANGGAATDNGKSLCSGRSPTWAQSDASGRYSGWIQLSTIGGETGQRRTPP
jgi:hypothetical protein